MPEALARVQDRALVPALDRLGHTGLRCSAGGSPASIPEDPCVHLLQLQGRRAGTEQEGQQRVAVLGWGLW